MTSTKPPKPKRARTVDDRDLDDNDPIDDGGIKDMLRSLSTKMDSLNSAMSDVDNRFNVKMMGWNLRSLN